MRKTEIEKVVAEIDAISAYDPEAAHSKADDILRRCVPPEVDAAYQRLQERCRWW